jgi:predicted ATPase with chaperone activity
MPSRLSGVGTSKLTHRLTTILPVTSLAEALDTSYIHGVTSGTWYPPHGKWASHRS